MSVRRFHDMGISGWAAVFIFFLWLTPILIMGLLKYNVDLFSNFTESTVLTLGLVVWFLGVNIFSVVHYAFMFLWPGDESTNRFG